MKKDQKEQKYNDIIFTADVVRCYFGESRFDKDAAYRITLKSNNMPYDEITAFDDCGSKFTPTWLKDAEGYMNLKSKFDIPVKDVKGRKISIDDWIKSETATGSRVKVKIRQKEGAIYPVAISILEDGAAVDPFEGM